MLPQYKQNGESPLVVMATEQALLSCQLGAANQREYFDCPASGGGKSVCGQLQPIAGLHLENG